MTDTQSCYTVSSVVVLSQDSGHGVKYLSIKNAYFSGRGLELHSGMNSARAHLNIIFRSLLYMLML